MQFPEVPFRVPFNDGWSIRKPMGPFAGISDEAPTARPVALPHDAMRDEERAASAPSGAGSGYHTSSAWTYVKGFDVPADWEGRWVALEIDGAMSNSLVHINGDLVASRPYGYSRFWVEAGPHLRFGTANEVRVEVRTHMDSRWYTGAGLYRGVRLVVADSVHIAPDGIGVATLAVEGADAVVEVTTTVANDGPRSRRVRLRGELRDPDGQVVASASSPVTLLPGESTTVRSRHRISAARLWSLESPELHRAAITLTDGEELDRQDVSFGIRTVSVDAAHGFRLNGDSLKLRGACIHHDNGPLGAISLPAAELRKVTRLKEAGFNAVRMSHNPASQALLDACDAVGMLVMNEAFDVWSVEKTEYDYARHFETWWERDVEALVAGSRNHPSVVMYSLGNEIPELGKAGGARLNRMLAEKVRSLDPTRPVTNGINTLLSIDLSEKIAEAGGLNALMGGGSSSGDEAADMAAGMSAVATSLEVTDALEEISAALDVTGYNYAENRFALDAELFPDRVVVGSETFPTMIAHNWALVEKYPHVIGDFTWTGWDYIGEAGIGGHAYEEVPGHVAAFGREYPFLLAYCGDIDITGHRRPASYYREIVFGLRTEPYIAVQRPEHHGHTRMAANAWQWSDSVGSWSWPGHEGAPVVVEVYADADEVQLLLDGAELGRTSVGGRRPMTAFFETTYSPGTLEAVAITGGEEVGRTSLRSAVGPLELRASADRDVLDADGTDLAYVEVRLADASGTVPCGSDVPVTVEVEGPAVLAGFCSADPRTEERFDTTVRTTFDGRALAVVRPTGAGAITVTVSAEGHPAVQVPLQAR